MANEKVGLFCIPSRISNIIHMSCVVIAFLGFFLNEMFMFTLSSGEKTEGKKKRNVLYKCCASTVIISLIMILLMLFIPMPVNTIWIAEFISLVPCGLAWLVKGESIKSLND